MDQASFSQSGFPFSGIEGHLLERLFDHMPMGIAVFDRDFRLIRANPAWIGWLTRVRGTPAGEAAAGRYIGELFPGSEAQFQAALPRLLSGESVRCEDWRAGHQGIAPDWERVFTPVIEHGQVTAVLDMVTDLSSQPHFLEAERLRRAAEGLREVLKIINSNHSLQEILDFIVRQANDLLQASSTMIRQVFYEDQVVRTVASIHLPADFDPVWETHFTPTETNQSLMARELVVVEDVQNTYGPYVVDPQEVIETHMTGLVSTVRHYKTLLKVPLFVKGRIYGAMTFHYEQPRTFSDEDLRLALSLADQAALSIENARLIDQVKETAVTEERNRLARELHDAVTQTLFSTTLTAEVLPRIWERSPAEGRRKLEELRELTRGALAEMRTLLMELRPDALADAELKDLLRHLTNAFIARARVPVQLVIEGNFKLPLEVKIAFYRIAQEALNNIARHAEADQVTVSLECQAGQVGLRICDDGLGFDSGRALGADHYGLRIIRERAEQVGAKLEITSQVDAGTQLHVLWSASQASETGSPA